MKTLSSKNSRLALCVLSIVSACLWWQAAFADITVTLRPVDPKAKNFEYILIVTGAPPNTPIKVFGSFGGPPYDADPIIKGTTDKDGKYKPPRFSEFKDGLRKTDFKIEIGEGNDTKTYQGIVRPGGTYKAKEDKVQGNPGNGMLNLNGLPFDFGSSVCVASLDGSGEVSDNIELTNLSTTHGYAFQSLSVYQNLSSEFFDASAFDSGAAIATGTVSLDVYADSQIEVAEVLAVAADTGNTTPADLNECLNSEECVGGGDSLVFIGPNTGDEAPGINLGSHTVAPDSYDLVIGTAAPILDDSNVGEPIYFAFAHDCQVTATTTSTASRATDSEQPER